MEVMWTIIDTEQGRYLLAKTKHGVCYIDRITDDAKDIDDFYQWCYKRISLDVEFIEDVKLLEEDIIELQQYWRGERQQFGMQLDLRGTMFQVQVWKALLQIPYHETVSYEHIAKAIGNAAAVRAVGGAIGKNPILIVVPCHRVIGKNGSLTGFSAGMDLKKILLAHEEQNSKTSSRF